MHTIPEELILPNRTVAGLGKIKNLAVEARTFGNSGILVHGRSLERSGTLNAIHNQANELTIHHWRHSGGEPTLKDVEQLSEFIREKNVGWVAAVGGGSVIDLAKAATGLCLAPQSIADYHGGGAVPPAKIPFLAVPTTAGTGSEATTVSVLTDAEKKLKKSIRHHSHLARTVILDGELLRSCPPQVVAASGLDALTQGIESFISRGATWLTDQLALKAVKLVADNLEPVFNSSVRDAETMQQLLEGSYLAGLALANARLGLVHGLAHPLGARFNLPHGLACAICLPHILEFNKQDALAKYKRLNATIGEDVCDYSKRLLKIFNLPNPLAGVNIHDQEQIINETLASGSTRANPRRVRAEDVQTILQKFSMEN